jgi:hypothetical protein
VVEVGLSQFENFADKRLGPPGQEGGPSETQAISRSSSERGGWWVKHTKEFSVCVAVGMGITPHPPHGSGRTDFPYPALASGQPPKRADG